MLKDKTCWRTNVGSLLLCAFGLVGAVGLSAGCGPDATPPEPGDTGLAGDVSSEAGVSDADRADVDAAGGPDAAQTDTGDGGGNDGVDGGGDGGGGADSKVPGQWTVCTSDVDCPIVGGSCLKIVEYNRADHDGASEVKISELIEGVEEGQGICSRKCSNDPTVCDAMKWKAADGENASAACFVLTAGASPYALKEGDGETFSDEMEAGRAFAAVCLPPLAKSDRHPAKFCSSCAEQGECGDSTTCVNLMTDTARRGAEEVGTSACLPGCESSEDCALGFECADVGDGMGGEAGKHCLPVARTCGGCVDKDGDSFGSGHCGPADARQTAHDCDDANEIAHYDPADMEHPFPMHCGDHDYNCNGESDDDEQIGYKKFGAEHCTACGDTCEGSAGGDAVYQCVPTGQDDSPACLPSCPTGKSADCDGNPMNGCEIKLADAKMDAAKAKFLFYEDGDGDGYGEASTAQVFCDLKTAKKHMMAPVSEGGDCAPMNKDISPGATEVCDGIDNNCDMSTDEGCDDDGDGYCDGSMTVVKGMNGNFPAVCSNGGGDCDDTMGSGGKVYPGAAERESDVSKCRADRDEDGYGDKTPASGVAAGTDCDDGQGLVYPGAGERCNGVDDDCDGKTDEGATGGQMNTVGDACTPSTTKGECARGWSYACKLGGKPADASKNYDLTCAHANPAKPALEEPGFDGIDHSCDGYDRYLSGGPNKTFHAVWVRKGSGNSGSTAGMTPLRPADSLRDAMQKSTGASWCTQPTSTGLRVPCDVFVSTVTVPTGDAGLKLQNGASIIGGFDANKWTQSNVSDPKKWASAFVPTGTTSISIAAPANGDVVGVYGSNLVSKTLLANLSISTDNARSPAASNYGLRCVRCSGLVMKGVTINAGDGGPGGAGSVGTDGSDGDNGAQNGGGVSCMQSDKNITKSRCDAACRQTYNAGASRTSCLTRCKDRSHGAGGTGNLDAGLDFVEADGGDGGLTGGRPAGHGSGGKLLGWARAAGGQRGSLRIRSKASDIGLKATSGESGKMNDGGGGGGGIFFPGAPGPSTGGSGGCPGHGGKGGSPGGSSVGLIMVESAQVELTGVSVNAGSGMAGGIGGNGGAGGRGGLPHPGAGVGGSGAGGDGGGGGAGGHSIGCLLVNTSFSTTFDPAKSCTTQGAAGAGGMGGMGGACGGGRANCGKKRNGEEGQAGEAGTSGLGCDWYQISRTLGSQIPLKSSCQHVP